MKKVGQPVAEKIIIREALPEDADAIGRKLLNAAEGLARTRNADFIVLDSSLLAAPFYKSCGFYELETGMHRLRSGREMPSIWMRKDLANHIN